MSPTRPVQWKKRIPLLGALLLLFSAGPYISRAPWFDEVLTLDWLVWPFREIPFKYSIPNNHILYTLCLCAWRNLLGLFGLYGTLYLRILSLLFGAGAVVLISRRMLRACGMYSALPVLILLAGSGPFLLFGTALRGYMASVLFVTAAFCFAELWMKRNRPAHFVFYFLFCYCSVWTIPTNLLSVGAGLLFLLPIGCRSGKNFLRLLLLGISALGALFLAYLPIFRKFLKVSGIREGWSSYPDFCWNYYGTFLFIFFPVLIFSLIGMFSFLKRKRMRLRVLCFFGVFLVPAVSGLLFQVAPFPRVFFPMSGIVALVLCIFLSGYLRGKRGVWRRLPLISGVVWLMLFPHITPFFSEFLFGSHSRDDLLYPYPMSVNFAPHKIANRLARACYFEGLRSVFVDFDADPPSIQYQLPDGKIPPDFIVRDRPDFGRVQWLGPEDWIVCRDDRAFQAVRKRFSLPGEYRCLKETENLYQKIYVPSGAFPQTE